MTSPAPLSSLVHLPPSSDAEPDEYDIFTSAIGRIFSDDALAMHGDPGTTVIYRPSWPILQVLTAAAASSNTTTTTTTTTTTAGPSSSATTDPPNTTPTTSDSTDTAVPPSRAGDIYLRLADPAGESGRRRFAHYLWNAGLLAAELMGHWSSAAGNGGGGDGGGSGGGGGGGGGGGRDGASDMSSDSASPLSFGTHVRAHDWDVAGQTVVELGAGTGVPGIVAALCGAARTCITDYPAPEALASIAANVAANTAGHGGEEVRGKVSVVGHQWGVFGSGGDREKEGKGDGDDGKEEEEQLLPEQGGFGRVLAADCLWMEAEHENLARSMAYFLSETDEDAQVWVIAGFHTGWPCVANFFDAVERLGELALVDRWEVNMEWEEREWVGVRREEVGSRKKWLVVAIFKRKRK